MTMPQGSSGLESNAWGHEWVMQKNASTLGDRDQATVEAYLKNNSTANSFDPWGQAFDNFWNGIMGGFRSLDAFFRHLGMFLTGVVDGTVEAITNAWNGFVDGVATVGDAVSQMFNEAGSFVVNVATAVVDGIGSTIGGFLNMLFSVFDGQGKNDPAADVATYRTAHEVVNAANNVADVVYKTSDSLETQTGFFNETRVVPTWVGNSADDVCYPQVLVDGTATPDAGQLVMIPIRTQQLRTYDSVKFGMALSSTPVMDECIVGVYHMNETTGDCTKVVDLGNVKSQLVVGQNVQTLMLPSVVTVQKGEVYYVAVLQKGASRNAMFRWSATLNFNTGTYPRYVGSYHSDSPWGSLPATIDHTKVVSGVRYWGAMGIATPVYASGNASYSYSFTTGSVSSSPIPSTLWAKRGTADITVGFMGGEVSAGGWGTYTYMGQLGTTDQVIGAKFNFSSTVNAITNPYSNGIGVITARGKPGSSKFVALYVDTAQSDTFAYIKTYDATSDSNTAHKYNLTYNGAARDVFQLTSTSNPVRTENPSWRLECQGNYYRGYHNNVKVLEWHDSNGMFAFDSTHSEVGVSLYRPSSGTWTAAKIKDWYANDI